MKKIYDGYFEVVKQVSNYTVKFKISYINPICAEIFSHPIGAGGGSRMTPPPLISGHSGHKETNLKANDQVLQENKL